MIVPDLFRTCLIAGGTKLVSRIDGSGGCINGRSRASVAFGWALLGCLSMLKESASTHWKVCSWLSNCDAYSDVCFVLVRLWLV